MIGQIFPQPLCGYWIGPGLFKLTAAFLYRNGSIEVDVPAGFVSDGASIPKIAWSIVGGPWTGKYRNAAVVHDYLYSVQTFTRRITDREFLVGMKGLGVGWWKRGTMYNCVRLVAWIPWRKCKKKLLNK